MRHLEVSLSSWRCCVRCGGVTLRITVGSGEAVVAAAAGPVVLLGSLQFQDALVF